MEHLHWQTTRSCSSSSQVLCSSRIRRCSDVTLRIGSRIWWIRSCIVRSSRHRSASSKRCTTSLKKRLVARSGLTCKSSKTLNTSMKKRSTSFNGNFWNQKWTSFTPSISRRRGGMISSKVRDWSKIFSQCWLRMRPLAYRLKSDSSRENTTVTFRDWSTRTKKRRSSSSLCRIA